MITDKQKTVQETLKEIIEKEKSKQVKVKPQISLQDFIEKLHQHIEKLKKAK